MSHFSLYRMTVVSNWEGKPHVSFPFRGTFVDFDDAKALAEVRQPVEGGAFLIVERNGGRTTTIPEDFLPELAKLLEPYHASHR
jgi:hypothetical protein